MRVVICDFFKGVSIRIDFHIYDDLRFLTYGRGERWICHTYLSFHRYITSIERNIFIIKVYHQSQIQKTPTLLIPPFESGIPSRESPLGGGCRPLDTFQNMSNRSLLYAVALIEDFHPGRCLRRKSALCERRLGRTTGLYGMIRHL